MGDEKQGESHPARTDDDPEKAAKDVAEQGHDTNGGDAGSEAIGDGPSGGAPTGGTGEGDSSATGDGPSGGAPSDSSGS